jgi:uncharacterized 2Fe-2S/4Fe-4S cluster protein (DUF4445 family)
LKQKTIELIFQPSNLQLKIPSNLTILQVAQKSGINISSECGGKGTCGKCKVRIEKGRKGLSSLTKKEIHYLSDDEIDQQFRLACQTRLSTNSTIFIPEQSRIIKTKLQTKGIELNIIPSPVLKKYFLKLPNPSLNDNRSDEDRLLDSLKNQMNISDLIINYEVFKDLPIILRKENWKVTVTVWKNEIRAIELGDTSSRSFGLAVDIGTTKLAAYLVKLETGVTIASDSMINPQVFFGGDVISRISYVLNSGVDGLEELQESVVKGINELSRQCCAMADVKIDEIYEFNFVGNTVMQLLLLGVWPGFLAYSPYSPVISRNIDVVASRIGLNAHPNANAHFLPIIGGFVGADTVSVILASKMLEKDKVTMAIDIGTNTEICIGNKDRLLVDSCASGPAFEGMSTKFGMRAAQGAIEQISIDPKNLEVNYQIIDDTQPIGICGSGFIDLLAELLKCGLITKKGNFASGISDRTSRLRKTSQGWEFVIVWKIETNLLSDIVITQRDIRELQKAKAAVHTGVELLMKKMGFTEDDIANLFIAGAFGNNISFENARTIGLIPEISLDRILFMGNLAGVGAKMTLISKDMREYAEKISKKVTYYELGVDPDFQNEYIRSLDLPYANLEKYPITSELLRKHVKMF